MKVIALKTFENAGINIAEGSKRHLGVVITLIEYRENYVTEKVNIWVNEPNTLCDIARIEPQTAYSCFVRGYKHKLTYIMRAIRNISHQLEKIDKLILTKFIPEITGDICVNMVVWVSEYFQSLQVLKMSKLTNHVTRSTKQNN